MYDTPKILRREVKQWIYTYFIVSSIVLALLHVYFTELDKDQSTHDEVLLLCFHSFLSSCSDLFINSNQSINPHGNIITLGNDTAVKLSSLFETKQCLANYRQENIYYKQHSLTMWIILVSYKSKTDRSLIKRQLVYVSSYNREDNKKVNKMSSRNAT